MMEKNDNGDDLDYARQVVIDLEDNISNTIHILSSIRDRIINENNPIEHCFTILKIESALYEISKIKLKKIL